MTKAMRESCQSSEVQRRGKVIRGRGKSLCVLDRELVAGVTKRVVQNENSFVCQSAYTSYFNEIDLFRICLSHSFSKGANSSFCSQLI